MTGTHVEPGLETLESRARERLAPDYELGTVLAADAKRARFIARARRGAQLELELAVLARDALSTDVDERLARTIELWASLRHPNILPIVSSGASDALRWVATPAAPERTLAHRLAAGRVPTKAGALQILEDVCAAIQAAHDIGLLHGRIGLQQVQLLPDGHAVLGEFGLAAVESAGSLDEPSAEDDLVASARMLGELLARCREPHRRNGGGLDGLEALATLLARVGSGSPWAERPATPRELAHQARDAVRTAEVGNASSQPQPLLMVGPASGGPRRATRLLLIGSLLATATAGMWFVDTGSGASQLLEPLTSAASTALTPLAHEAIARSADTPLTPAQELPDVALPSAPPARAPATRVPRDPPRPPPRAVNPVRSDRRAVVQAVGSSPAPSPAPAPAPTVAPVVAPALEPQIGRLSVSSRPWGSVLVDGIRIGDSPLRQVELDAGTRHVRIERAGYVPFDTTITIRAAEAVRLIDILLVRSP